LPAVEGATDKEERPATPLDYLEKIFRVPFHLPEMTRIGFGNMMDKLTEPPKKLPAKGVGIQKPEISERVDQKQEVVVPKVVLPPSRDQPSDKLKRIDSGRRSEPRDETSMIEGSVPLQPWEREALKDHHELIQTPRAATRLLNTYRLVRAGVPRGEWDSFRGDEKASGECRVAMLFLAAAAGYPAVVRDWFAVLRSTDPQTVFSSNGAAEFKSAEWERFKSVHSKTPAQQPLSKELCSKWLDRVERFTF